MSIAAIRLFVTIERPPQPRGIVISITRISTCALVGVLALAPLSRATAQGPSLGATIAFKATTLGVGPEIGFRFMPRLSIKVGANFGTISRDLTSSGIGYGANVKWRSYSAMLDLHALGPIHFSGGIIRNGNELQLDGDPERDRDPGPDHLRRGRSRHHHRQGGVQEGGPVSGNGFRDGWPRGVPAGARRDVPGKPPDHVHGHPGQLPASAQSAFDTAVQAEASQIQTDLDGRSYLEDLAGGWIGELQIKI